MNKRKAKKPPRNGPAANDTHEAGKKPSIPMERNGLQATVDLPRSPAHGRPRCQARSSRSGKQCRKASRRGYEKCATHGPGTGKRVREGTRQSPARGPLRTGGHVQQKTIQRMWEEFAAIDPRLKDRVDLYRQHPDRLRDKSELLAKLWALSDVLSEDVKFTDDKGNAQLPPYLTALRSITDALQVVARIEARERESSSVPRAIVQVFVARIYHVFRQFVPADKLEVALDAVRRVKLPEAPARG
jgi:hypothetical protein